MRGFRENILKSRQLGFSTFIAGLFYIDTVTVPNTQTVVIAQDQGSTERLFQIVRRFQNLLPKDLQLPTRYDTKNVLYWPTIDSYYFVGTAGSKKIGRGGTINNVHASEVAFWENPQEIVAGLMEAVPESGNIVLETTANGLGGWYYDEFWRGWIGQGAFKSRFFPWVFEDRYQAQRLSTGEEFVRNEEEDEYNNRVRKFWQIDLTDDQLRWRRNKTLTLRRAFPQEYPITPEEAFISSGTTFFTETGLKYVESTLTEPSNIEVPVRFRELRRVAPNHFACWARPQDGHMYVIGVDPSEGIEEDREHDYSPVQVVDYTTWEQVARLHGRFEPRELALIVNDLAIWYKMALVNVERNNHGHSVINTLMHECGYPLQSNNAVTGLYVHREFDARKVQRLPRPGWPQNPKTKAIMADAFYAAIEDQTTIIHDVDTWREMRTYSKLPGGKIGGEAGTHDDLVTAYGLAIVIIPKARPNVRSADSVKVHSCYGRYK